MSHSVTAPVASRITVKLAASIAGGPSAARVSSEFAAKAIMASVVNAAAYMRFPLAAHYRPVGRATPRTARPPQ